MGAFQAQYGKTGISISTSTAHGTELIAHGTVMCCVHNRKKAAGLLLPGFRGIINTVQVDSSPFLFLYYQVLHCARYSVFAIIISLICAKGYQNQEIRDPGQKQPPKKHEAKGDAPGLKSSDVSLVSGSEGSN
jgi:hypothetical protein